ncbi:LysE family translocator [Proteus cibarius]|uniref:LysE family translocator n=1 Tax=Proteus terrae subsp. cibarius TaxID=626774 RepID=A0A8I0WP90_9GAMM|nr:MULTISPECIES: LysE family translocator [Proteus]MBG2914033.1 LysE family translocator [Proteus terrae subsp. cibarius]MBG6038935.1 LysE family translocator [Proteus terrae subsp. cibarius]MCM2368260.1 LysE family translocator [Proteus sp. FZP2095]QGW04802.1 LysE family translocator [Proteus terrae subsp. cibarius]QHD93873.1 LysE family transporter [Proteus terrae subsp. cibarius]
MTISLVFSLTIFLFIAAITPGPNNLLLTSSGANVGFKGSLKLMAGIMLGMQCVLLSSAFGVAALLIIYPALHIGLKIIGSAYLLWLAWKTATSSYQRLDIPAKTPQAVSWFQGGLLQFLNPKAWMMGLGAVGSFSLSGDAYFSSVIAISIVMVIVNFVAGIVWILGGTLISLFLQSRRSWFVFNISMGLLTALCVPLIWIE